ncbi:MAG: flagellar M-ring protein FliF [Desulfofustis sp.]|nr:flagellar M-ring protein FliF [Desulfofustis sp.]
MQWTTKRKALFGGLLIIVALALLIVLLTLIDEDEYRLLYANLITEDYLAISNFLKLSDINFKENPAQRSIYIPADSVDLTRLELAKQKLPSFNNGNDLVGSQPLATFQSLTGGDPRIVVQHELSRTLSALDQIRSARVHLESAPEDSSLNSIPGATVLLSLAPGRPLTADQLQTVIHLVATSVTSLESSNVRVFDSSGNLLSGKSRLRDALLFPDSTLSYQTSVERNLERKAQDLVDAMIGKGQTLIKISASLDFSRNETTSESYDPDDAVVKSEQIERQPLPDAGSEDLSSQNAGSRYRSSVTTSSKVDYEISKTTSKTINPVGALKQISVTILVADEKRIGGDGTVSFQPRSDEELEAIRSLVAGVLSLKPERGDIINLRRMPADRLNVPQSPAKISPLYEIFDLIPVGKIILILSIFLLFYLLLLKPIIGLLRAEMDLTGSDSPPPEEGNSVDHGPDRQEEDIAVKLKNEVHSNPLAAAHIIKRWIQEA